VCDGAPAWMALRVLGRVVIGRSSCQATDATAACAPMPSGLVTF
jgi:hypothetical protein